MEDFELYEIGKNAYVKFFSKNNQVELKIDKHPYLFTERHAYVFAKLAKAIQEYEVEFYE